MKNHTLLNTSFKALLGLAAMTCMNAHAVVINFNNLAFNGPDGSSMPVNPIHAGGFVVGAQDNDPPSLMVWSKHDSRQADPGHATVVTGNPNTISTLTRANQRAFDFQSIALGDGLNKRYADKITFTFFKNGGGQVSQSIVLDNKEGLQTFQFGLSNLLKVTWQYAGGGIPLFQFDDISVQPNNSPVVSPVPEPSSYGMMAAGLGFLGFLARRQSRRGKA